MTDPLVALAREAITAQVTEGRLIGVPSGIKKDLQQKAGVFVSLHKGDSLRGCIGTFMPTRDNLALEIIQNAISAAQEDPRFPPVRKEELRDLDISVDVLFPPEKVDGIEELDAKKYGVIVKAGYKRGLLLPDLDGVDTPAQQIQICRMKGGIGEKEPVELFRFEVKRHH